MHSPRFSSVSEHDSCFCSIAYILIWSLFSDSLSVSVDEFESLSHTLNFFVIGVSFAEFNFHKPYLWICCCVLNLEWVNSPLHKLQKHRRESNRLDISEDVVRNVTALTTTVRVIIKQQWQFIKNNCFHWFERWSSPTWLHSRGSGGFFGFHTL